MMNARALFVLLSSLGAVMFLSPEPKLRRINNEIILVEAAHGNSLSRQGRGAVESAKKAAEDVVHTASDYAKHTGEGIRQMSSAAYDKLSSSARSGEEAARERVRQTYEDGAGLASRAKEEGMHRAQQVSEDSSNAASEAGREGLRRTRHAYDQASSNLEDAREQAGEYVSANVRDRVGDTAHSAGDAAHTLGDRIKEVGKDGDDYKSRLTRAKESLKEAAQYQPNLGQGVGYYPPEDPEQTEQVSFLKRRVEEEARKLQESLEGARDSAKDAMEKAGEALGLLKDQLEELDHTHYTLDSARGKIREYYDTTKANVLNALSKREQQLGRSLEAAKNNVEAYYDRAKETSLETLESQKEKLGQHLHVLRIKLNRGREAVFDYGISTFRNSKEAIAEEKNKLLSKIQAIEEEAKRKVAESVTGAQRWAHEKVTTLNEKEKVAVRVCRHWIRRMVPALIRLVHLFLFASAYGSAVWVTFISGFVLSRNISRQQFGLVQSKIFPVYFRLVAAQITLLLATHMGLHPSPPLSLPEQLQYYNLTACLSLALLNMFCLEPLVTKAMFDKLRLEKEESRSVDAGQVPVADESAGAQLGSVGKRLEMLHTYSSIANLLMLVGLTWHLWFLNCRLAL